MPNASADYLANSPFTRGVLEADTDFWRGYINARPSPPESFLRLINEYHQGNGNGQNAVAHDVGTGPGNIAQRLLPYYDYVVGSDVNVKALDAARALIPPGELERMTFVESPAEELPTAPILEHAGQGKTDLLVVSECIGLLDAPKALSSFHTMLRPGGTLAIYFYGRPIFVGASSAARNEIYDRLANHVLRCLHPIKDTPSFCLFYRSAETLASWLDNIELPIQSWEKVERLKWNHDCPLIFNGRSGYDFDFETIDRTHHGDTKREAIDRDFWAEEMDFDRVATYAGLVFPNYREVPGAAERVAKVDEVLQEMKEAMGDQKHRVTFPVSLILATKT